MNLHIASYVILNDVSAGMSSRMRDSRTASVRNVPSYALINFNFLFPKISSRTVHRREVRDSLEWLREG